MTVDHHPLFCDASDLPEARVEVPTADIRAGGSDRADATTTRVVAAASRDLLRPLSAAKLCCASLSEGRIPPTQAEKLSNAPVAPWLVAAIIGRLRGIGQLSPGKASVRVSGVDPGLVQRRLGDDLRLAAEAKALGLRHMPAAATERRGRRWRRGGGHRPARCPAA